MPSTKIVRTVSNGQTPASPAARAIARRADELSASPAAETPVAQGTTEEISVAEWVGQIAVFKLDTGMGIKGRIFGETNDFVQLDKAVIRKKNIVYVRILPEWSAA